MPRPVQHPRQAPRGTACNVACGALLPPSTSRKHVPVTAGADRRGTDTSGTWPRSYRARPGDGPAAVLAVAESAPLTSAHRVLHSPSGPTATFTLATYAACEPARSGPAGRRCCCRRGMSIACSAWSSVSFSPRTTWTTRLPLPLAAGKGRRVGRGGELGCLHRLLNSLNRRRQVLRAGPGPGWRTGG